MLNAVINNTGTGPNDIWNGATVASSINSAISGQVLTDVDIDVISNDTLSGLAARNGFTPVAGSAMLVTAQTDSTQNGIYSAASGAWSRYKWTGSAFATDSTMTTYSQLGYNYGFFRVNGNGKFYQVVIQKPSATFGNSTVNIIPSVLSNSFQLPPVWTANTLVRAGQMVTIATTFMSAPYYFFAGEVVSSNSLRTTRATFDSIEASFWKLRQSNGNLGASATSGNLALNVPANTPSSIGSVTLPNPGIYLLYGAVRVQTSWTGEVVATYFSHTLNGDISSGINGCNVLWGYASASQSGAVGRNISIQLIYYNTVASRTIYLNVQNSSTTSLSVLSDFNGASNISYIQIR